MSPKWRRQMDERSTYTGREEETKAIHSSAEAGDSQGMGSYGEWSAGSRETRDTSHDSVSLEKAAGTRSGRVSQGSSLQGRSSDTGAGERECETEGGLGASGSGVDALEKKDELGLTGRVSGQRYSREQKERIVSEVEKLKGQGISVCAALRRLGIPRSTFYSWREHTGFSQRPKPAHRLLEAEQGKIVSLKVRKPYLSHRQISGLLRHDDMWVSPSSCYRTLKSAGLVWEWSLREAPWKTPKYEPFRPNQIWGEDWTGLVINGKRRYVLTIIDLFSRYVIAWGIVRTVTHREVQDLVALAYMSEGIEKQSQNPILRTDPGSPNIAADVRVFLREIGIGFSPGRTARPTDNARQERFYRTLKQEEIYCQQSYASLETARTSIARYIDYYNEVRPHQALFGYPPGHVHRIGNKSDLKKDHDMRVALAKERRRDKNLQTINQQPTTFFP